MPKNKTPKAGYEQIGRHRKYQARLALGGHTAAVVSPPPLPPATQMVTLWLLLRAFAGGCTAKTWIEAVSNGVSAFQDPAVKHARRTLTVIVLILGCLVAVISWLCPVYGVHAMDETYGSTELVQRKRGSRS